MANKQEGCADILKVPRVYIPGQAHSFPWEISPENTVGEEIERIIDNYRLPGCEDDYVMVLTNPRGTEELSSCRQFTSYVEKFQLHHDGRPNVTIHLYNRGDPDIDGGQGYQLPGGQGEGQGAQGGGDQLSSLKINVKRQ